jgi:acetoin utilization deacetylase AcuC-like enzyme
MLLYHDPRFLEHDTGRGHPERPARLVAITERLAKTGLMNRASQPDWQAADVDRLALVHDRSYITQIEATARSGGGRLDSDTVCSGKSYQAATLAAGAVCDAIDRVIIGEEKRALCLVRPPGHHALPSAAMGFCLFGNVAVAARYATQQLQLDQILIVDWDVHHGNGTQAIFWEDPRVGFLSIHRFPFYPGSGDEDEVGSGRGLGTKVNVPIAFGTSRSDFLARFEAALAHICQRIQPQLVLVSAGFDAHRDDPIGSLGLETEDFGPLTRLVLDAAAAYAGGRLVSVLEGGYNTHALADCVALHAEGLLAG